ncbi:MAG TPA: hypothetical protein VED01_13900 [Burkholderiales bacterium]|nr:hypothetical protein [Burkholderiales bacterium]
MSDAGSSNSTPAGSRWYFYETPAGGWQWDHVDENGAVIARAPHPFRSRTACVSDAKARGYGTEERTKALT